MSYVRTEIAANGVARITFFHEKHNSLPSDLLQALVNAFEAAGHDTRVQLIVLASVGHRVFCSGASFDELMTIHDAQTGLQFFSGFGNVINAMRKCGKIVVGRVHGKAVGGGVGLAAATDYCFASQWAAFRLSELAVGFGPFVIGPAVERKIGLAAFSQLALTPDAWQSAHWGKEKGLFQHVFDTVEEMDEHLEQFCSTLSAYSPQALAELKSIFWQGTDHWDRLLPERAAISGRLCLTEYSKSAIEKFKSK